jgi:dextranase
VAAAPAAATYLELWPPHAEYAHVTRWIDTARAVAPSKAVVIAAYLSALRDAGRDRAARAGAVEAALLLTTVVEAAGAYHHVLADGGRLLVDGYYPAALALRRVEAERLRAAWQFSARFVHLLSDPGARVIETPELELTDGNGLSLPLADTPRAGTVWVRATVVQDGRAVLQLVDLRAQADARWDAMRQPTPVARGWLLRWRGRPAPRLALSPWHVSGRIVQPVTPAPGAESMRLPRFRRWCVLV